MFSECITFYNSLNFVFSPSIVINFFLFLLYLGRVSQFYLSIIDVTFFILFILLLPVNNTLWFQIPYFLKLDFYLKLFFIYNFLVFSIDHIRLYHIGNTNYLYPEVQIFRNVKFFRLFSESAGCCFLCSALFICSFIFSLQSSLNKIKLVKSILTIRESLYMPSVFITLSLHVTVSSIFATYT